MSEEGHPTLEELLVRHRDQLCAIVGARARGLMRFESVDDLVQGIHLRALKVHDQFEYQGEAAFMGWIRRIAEQHISDQNRHWKAKKRRATRLLRISKLRGESQAPGAVEPTSGQTGAPTFAQRREALVNATRALAVLLPRDQQIIRLLTEGATTEELAVELGVSPAAAEKARTRAQERLRKAAAAIR